MLERPHGKVIFIGGTASTGKSTVAHELARHLHIDKIVDTDLVLTAVRSVLSRSTHPALFENIFDQIDIIKTYVPSDILDPSLDRPSQLYYVLRGLIAIRDRAIVKKAAYIIEGVHAVPHLLPSPPEPIMQQVFLLSVSPSTLHTRLIARAEFQAGEAGIIQEEAYFAQTWAYQEYLLNQASEDVKIVHNDNSLAKTVKCMCQLLEKHSVTRL